MKNTPENINMFKHFLTENNCRGDFNYVLFTDSNYHNIDSMLTQHKIDEFIIDRFTKDAGNEWRQISQDWKALFVGAKIIHRAIQDNEKHFDNIRNEIDKVKQSYESRVEFCNKIVNEQLLNQFHNYVQTALKNQDYESIKVLKDIFDNAIKEFEI